MIIGTKVAWPIDDSKCNGLWPELSCTTFHSSSAIVAGLFPSHSVSTSSIALLDLLLIDELGKSSITVAAAFCRERITL